MPDVSLGVGSKVEPVVFRGDLAPDGVNRFLSINSSQLNFPLLNDSGQVVFWATLSDGSSGVFRDDGSTGVEIYRTGQAVPGGNGYFNLLGSAAFNQAGEFAFRSTVSSTVGGANDSQGVFIGDGTILGEIARSGQTLADGSSNLESLLPPLLNDAGEVVFGATLRNTPGGMSDNEAIFVSDSNALRQIAREGQPAPDGDGQFGAPAFISWNNLGEAAFRVRLNDTSGGVRTDSGVFRGDGTTLQKIIRKGDATPTGDGTLAPDMNGTKINNAGEVLFRALVSFDNGETAAREGLYRGDGATLIELARSGQSAPDHNGTFSNFAGGSGSKLNDRGQAVFSATLIGTTGGFGDDSGIFRSDGSSLVQIVREGQTALDGNGTLVLNPLSISALNDAGQVAFHVGLDPSNPFFESAVYLFDDTLGLVQVARSGQQLFGSTITTLNHWFGGGRGGGGIQPVGLTNTGPTRVLYQFSLADGRSGIALWTLVPEPTSIVIVSIGAALIGFVSKWPWRGRPRNLD